MKAPREFQRTVLVCGGRDYDDENTLRALLDHVHANRGIWTILQGGARGADTLAHQWAIARGVRSLTVPAQWDKHGRAAGPIRNQEMLNLINPGYDGVIAFPGGAGTRNMVDIARDKGFEPLVVTPE